MRHQYMIKTLLYKQLFVVITVIYWHKSYIIAREIKKNENWWKYSYYFSIFGLYFRSSCCFMLSYRNILKLLFSSLFFFESKLYTERRNVNGNNLLRSLSRFSSLYDVIWKIWKELLPHKTMHILHTLCIKRLKEKILKSHCYVPFFIITNCFHSNVTKWGRSNASEAYLW